MSKKYNTDDDPDKQPSHRTIQREDSKKEESKHSSTD